MSYLTDLPIELIIEIIKQVAPSHEDQAAVGKDAAWTPLETYRAYIKPYALSPVDDSDPLPRSLVAYPIYEDLCSLRLFVIVRVFRFGSD
jgi:hypothetical protein